ncbi:hypothetical protein [Mesobacillus maritimus]|uniref:Uncharacterized protein n=1 Tax=Mesobacillus maritimus TaxID=1643336 RepID=A0ABS7JZF3_9BACI|nr:hypothetical protein [Mesobacillus maritimus]MBY0095255.1 hypothetical protein [Mesobacillus maritimus]
MQTLTVVLFTCSVASFLAMFHHLVKMQRPGIYPSKKVLKQRAGLLATTGAFLLVLGFIFSLF